MRPRLGGQLDRHLTQLHWSRRCTISAHIPRLHCHQGDVLRQHSVLQRNLRHLLLNWFGFGGGHIRAGRSGTAHLQWTGGTRWCWPVNFQVTNELARRQFYEERLVTVAGWCWERERNFGFCVTNLQLEIGRQFWVCRVSPLENGVNELPISTEHGRELTGHQLNIGHAENRHGCSSNSRLQGPVQLASHAALQWLTDAVFDEFGTTVTGQSDSVDQGAAGALTEPESEDPGCGGIAADQRDDFLGVADFTVGQDENLPAEAGLGWVGVDFLERFEDLRAAEVGTDCVGVFLGLRNRKLQNRMKQYLMRVYQLHYVSINTSIKRKVGTENEKCPKLTCRNMQAKRRAYQAFLWTGEYSTFFSKSLNLSWDRSHCGMWTYLSNLSTVSSPEFCSVRAST